MGTTNYDDIAVDHGRVVASPDAGQTVKFGSTAVTGTEVVTHGLTTVTGAVATLGEDPGTDAGDAASVSVAISGTTVTIKCWQDDFTAATAEATVNWIVFGEA